MAAAFEPNVSILPSGQRRWMGTGPPTVAGDAPDSNGFFKGDRITNTAPTGGAALAWLCVKAGSPGVWLPEGGTNNQVTVSLTTAQIISLNSVPVTLVAAPGAGLVLVPEWLALTMVTTATGFANGGAIQVVYHGQTTALTGAIANGVVIAGAGTSYSLVQSTAATTTMLANTALDLYSTVADFITGTGTAKVTLKYFVIQA